MSNNKSSVHEQNQLNPYAALGSSFSKRSDTSSNSVLTLGGSHKQELGDVSIGSQLASDNGSMHSEHHAMADMELSLTKKEIEGGSYMEDGASSPTGRPKSAFSRMFTEPPLRTLQERISAGASVVGGTKDCVDPMTVPLCFSRPLGFSSDDLAYLTLHSQPDCATILETNLRELRAGSVSRSETGEQQHTILYQSEEDNDDKNEFIDLQHITPSLDMYETPSSSFIRTQHQLPVLTTTLHQLAATMVMLNHIATEPYMTEPSNTLPLPPHPAAQLRAKRGDVYLSNDSQVQPSSANNNNNNNNDLGVTKNGVWIPKHQTLHSNDTHLILPRQNTKTASDSSNHHSKTSGNIIMNNTISASQQQHQHDTAASHSTNKLNLTRPLTATSTSLALKDAQITVIHKGIRWVHTHTFKQYVVLPLLASDTPLAHAALTLWNFYFSKQLLWIPIDTCLALLTSLTLPLILRALFSKDQSSTTSIVDSDPLTWIRGQHRNLTLAPYVRLSVLSFPVYAFFLASVTHALSHTDVEQKNDVTETVNKQKNMPVMPLEHASQFHPFVLIPLLTRRCIEALTHNISNQEKKLSIDMLQECDSQSKLLQDRLSLTHHMHTTYAEKLVNMIHTIFEQHQCNTRHFTVMQKLNRVNTSTGGSRAAQRPKTSRGQLKENEVYAIMPILEARVPILAQTPVLGRPLRDTPCVVSTDHSVLSRLTTSRPMTSRSSRRSTLTSAITTNTAATTLRPVVCQVTDSPVRAARKKATDPEKSQQFLESFGFAEQPQVEAQEFMDIEEEDPLHAYNEHVRTSTKEDPLALPLRTVLASLMPSHAELQEDHFDPSPAMGQQLPSTCTDALVSPQQYPQYAGRVDAKASALQNITATKYGQNEPMRKTHLSNNGLEQALYDPEVLSTSYSCLTIQFGTRPGLSFRLKQCLHHLGRVQAKRNALRTYRQEYSHMTNVRRDVITQYMQFQANEGEHPDVADLSDDEDVAPYYGARREQKKAQAREKRVQARNFGKLLGYSSKRPVLNKTTQLLRDAQRERTPAQAEEWSRRNIKSKPEIVNTQFVSTELWTSVGNLPALPVVTKDGDHQPVKGTKSRFQAFADEKNLTNLALPAPPLETFEPGDADCLSQRMTADTVLEALATAERAVARDDVLFNTRILLYLCALSHHEDREWLLRTMHPNNVGSVVTNITLHNAKQEKIDLQVNQYTEVKTLLEGLIDKNMSDAVAERVQESLESHPLVLSAITLTRPQNIWCLEDDMPTPQDTDWNPYNLEEDDIDTPEEFITNNIFVPIDGEPILQLQDNNDEYLE